MSVPKAAVNIKRIGERRKQIEAWMQENGWQIIKGNSSSVRGFREAASGVERLTYDIGASIVTTWVNHPLDGPTVLQRKVTDAKLKKVLAVPRTHLKGNHRKGFRKVKEIVRPSIKLGCAERLKRRKNDTETD